MLRTMVISLLLTPAMWALQAGQSAEPTSTPTMNAQTKATPPASDDELAQMRLDLEHMESLLNNMSSEITFLRDQNLQILLNTNGRMWTILIRDLRLQIDREERRRAAAPDHGTLPPETKPPSRATPR